jgi:hypothetical protein
MTFNTRGSGSESKYVHKYTGKPVNTYTRVYQSWFALAGLSGARRGILGSSAVMRIEEDNTNPVERVAVPQA